MSSSTQLDLEERCCERQVLESSEGPLHTSVVGPARGPVGPWLVAAVLTGTAVDTPLVLGMAAQPFLAAISLPLCELEPP